MRAACAQGTSATASCTSTCPQTVVESFRCCGSDTCRCVEAGQLSWLSLHSRASHMCCARRRCTKARLPRPQLSLPCSLLGGACPAQECGGHPCRTAILPFPAAGSTGRAHQAGQRAWEGGPSATLLPTPGPPTIPLLSLPSASAFRSLPSFRMGGWGRGPHCQQPRQRRWPQQPLQPLQRLWPQQPLQRLWPQQPLQRLWPQQPRQTLERLWPLQTLQASSQACMLLCLRQTWQHTRLQPLPLCLLCQEPLQRLTAARLQLCLRHPPLQARVQAYRLLPCSSPARLSQACQAAGGMGAMGRAHGQACRRILPCSSPARLSQARQAAGGMGAMGTAHGQACRRILPCSSPARLSQARRAAGGMGAMGTARGQACRLLPCSSPARLSQARRAAGAVGRPTGQACRLLPCSSQVLSPARRAAGAMGRPTGQS
jgi:hypothetical protein